MFSGYESLNLQPLHLKTRCTIIYWFGMSISKCCNVIKHFPYSRAVLLIATVDHVADGDWGVPRAGNLRTNTPARGEGEKTNDDER